jgi:hypothetical protein
MVLGQTVHRAELSAAVDALKRQKRFFPALLAPHAQRTPFHAKRKRNRLYVSLRKRSVPLNVHFPLTLIFSRYDSIS